MNFHKVVEVNTLRLQREHPSLYLSNLWVQMLLQKSNFQGGHWSEERKVHEKEFRIEESNWIGAIYGHMS